jgi:hypothetical protein
MLIGFLFYFMLNVIIKSVFFVPHFIDKDEE